MAKQPKKHGYYAADIIWLTLSLGSGLLAVLAWLQFNQSVTTGRHVNSMRRDLRQILRLLLDAVTGSLGCVVTGDKKFFAPLNVLVTNLPVCFDLLVETASGESDLSDQAAVIHPWPSVRDCVAMNTSGAFVHAVEILARLRKSPWVLNYA